MKKIAMTMALLLAGCAAQQSHQAITVVLTKDPNAVARCQSIGQIHSNSILTGVLQSQGYENMLTDLKNRAAARGATHVLLIDVSSSTASIDALGDAYRCG